MLARCRCEIRQLAQYRTGAETRSFKIGPPRLGSLFSSTLHRLSTGFNARWAVIVSPGSKAALEINLSLCFLTKYFVASGPNCSTLFQYNGTRERQTDRQTDR
ncbi:unnamed protein product [Ectocarpus sp. 12 AP-2014]